MPLATRTKWMGASTMLLVMAAGIQFAPSRPATPEFKCVSYFEQTGDNGKYEMKATFTFSFKKDGSGVIFTDGVVKYEGKKYTLRREALVTIKPVIGTPSTWQFTGIKETINISDNTPNDIYGRYFYDRNEHSGRYVTINKLDDYWLIGSIRSPAFLCRGQE